MILCVFGEGFFMGLTWIFGVRGRAVWVIGKFSGLEDFWVTCGDEFEGKGKFFLQFRSRQGHSSHSSIVLKVEFKKLPNKQNTKPRFQTVKTPTKCIISQQSQTNPLSVFIPQRSQQIISTFFHLKLKAAKKPFKTKSTKKLNFHFPPNSISIQSLAFPLPIFIRKKSSKHQTENVESLPRRRAEDE